MESVCVYCGSKNGKGEVYREAAVTLGKLLAEKNIRLIYGGGHVGLMGIVADVVISNGGEAIGVLPRFMDKKEVGHRGLTELFLVESMHERKLKMSELAGGFIAMPGGFGTLEELAEILTWAQLGLIHKPIGLLNVNGFYDQLLSLYDHMIDQEFLLPVYRKNLLVSSDPGSLMDGMENYKPVTLDKWLEKKA